VPLHAGIRVLADRDEIRVAGLGRVYFSTERLACVTRFPGAATPRSVRAANKTSPPVAAVRCPACQRWYHQSDEYPAGPTPSSACVDTDRTGRRVSVGAERIVRLRDVSRYPVLTGEFMIEMDASGRRFESVTVVGLGNIGGFAAGLVASFPAWSG